jgi:prophage regulatory protein
MLMRLRATLKERGRSASSHYRDIQDGLFTRPVMLGKRAVGWPAGEVAELNAARRAGVSDTQIRKIVDKLHDKRRRAYSDAYDPDIDQRLSYSEAYVDYANTPETKARARRLEAFVSASKLREVLNYSSVKHQTICEIARRKNPRRCLDHCTFWTLANMAVVMSEPYRGALSDQHCDELYAVEVPVNISPYCGGWSCKLGEKPGTRTFLITSILKRRQLDEVFKRLEAAATKLPPWNFVEGENQ